MEPYTDEQIAQAIIDLQKFAGIEEPVEQAIRNAKEFDLSEKEATQAAHRVVCGGKFGGEIQAYQEQKRH
jgi:DNA-binding transcriptional regulator YhcF (GntR family)